VKTQEHLGRLLDADSPFKARAAAWRAVVLGGLSRGHKELGEAYATGVQEKEARAKEFQNPIQQNRRDARQYAIELTESLGKISQALQGSDKVTLEFPFPTGSPNPSPVLGVIRGGEAPPQNQQIEAAMETIKRSILLQTTEMVGDGEETNRARTKFESGPVEISRTEFDFRLGQTLFAISGLFERKQLNEPQVRKILLERSLSLVGGALEASDEALKKQAEELHKEITDLQKKSSA
jgi:hypothetical protein